MGTLPAMLHFTRKRSSIRFYIKTLLLIAVIDGKELPDSQPYCERHPQAWDIYKFHWTRMHRYRCWFCLENFTYVDRINLCADMYGRSMQSEIVSFDVPTTPVNDTETECERRATIWYEKLMSSLEEMLYSKEEDKPRTELGMDVFKCPITRMNVTLKAKERVDDTVVTVPPTQTKKKKSKLSKTPTSKKKKSPSPVAQLRDFYLSVGRNLITVAVLTPDAFKGENMCIRDVHYYPECEPRIDECFVEDADW